MHAVWLGGVLVRAVWLLLCVLFGCMCAVRAVWLRVCLVRAVWLRVYECVLYGYGCISCVCLCTHAPVCVNAFIHVLYVCVCN